MPIRRVLLGVLCLLFVGLTLAWLRLDRSPPSWDDAYYLTNSLRLYDALVDNGIAGYAKGSLTVMGTKPPLIAMLGTPVYLLAGRHWRAAYVANLFFWCCTLAALYKIGRRYASARAGLIAVWIAGTMPILYGLAHWYLVECGLIAIVCWTILVASEITVWSAAFLGFLCGFGMLMKFSFPFYVAIPLIYFAIHQQHTIKLRTSIAAFGIPILLMAGPWYALNFRHALETALQSGSSSDAKLYQTGDILSAASLWRYLGNLFNAGHVLYFVALLVLLPLVFRKIRPNGKNGLTVCAVWAAPLLFLIFSHYRDLRWAAPLFPAVALALGFALDAFIGRWRVAGISMAAVLLLLPFASMLQSSFGVFGDARLELGGLLFEAPRLDYARRYDPREWPQRDILADIQRLAKFTGDEKKIVTIGSDKVRFNVDNFGVTALANKLPITLRTTAYDTNAAGGLESTDYFVYANGGEPESLFNVGRDRALQEVRESGKFIELPIGRRLPDGGIAHIFARRSGDHAYLSAGLERLTQCIVTFDDSIQLTGLSMEETQTGLEVKYRWTCLKRVRRDYWCFTHILDSNGKVGGYLDHQIGAGDPPTSLWKPGDVVYERSVFTGKLDASKIRVGIFDRASGERMHITTANFPVTDNQTALLVTR